jgi:hypothetical protein
MPRANPDLVALWGSCSVAVLIGLFLGELPIELALTSNQSRLAAPAFIMAFQSQRPLGHNRAAIDPSN